LPSFSFKRFFKTWLLLTTIELINFNIATNFKCLKDAF
jgi:hypothetical protein